MSVQPLPPGWLTRASWRARQQRRDHLNRVLRDLAAQPRPTRGGRVKPDPLGEQHWHELAVALGLVCHCGMPAVGRGLCTKHYKRALRAEQGAA